MVYSPEVNYLKYRKKQETYKKITKRTKSDNMNNIVIELQKVKNELEELRLLMEF